MYKVLEKETSLERSDKIFGGSKVEMSPRVWV